MAPKKVTAGQPFRPSAREWNTLVDTARALEAGVLNRSFELDLPQQSQTRVTVQNATGAALARFAVVGLGEPWKTPPEDLAQFQRQITFTAALPAALDVRYGVTVAPLQPGEFGEAVVSGLTVAQVNVMRETDPFATVEAGATTHLRSSPFGTARILWKGTGTGLKWSVVRLGDRPRFAVFELSASKWSADESNGWAQMPDCKPVLYFGDSQTYLADDSEPLETIWHAVGYPGVERADVRTLHQNTGLFPGKFGERDWVWCYWNDHEQRWQVLAAYEDHWRFALRESLPRCGSALANLVLHDDSRYCPVGLEFAVVDSIGVVAAETTGTRPAGTYGVAKYFADSGAWEVMAVGEGCCPSSSSSGSPSSEESPSSQPSSEPSSQPSSEFSEPSSLQPSETPTSESPSPCIEFIGGISFDQIPGYNANSRQVLMHNNGCLEWITLRSCDERPSSSQPEDQQ